MSLIPQAEVARSISQRHGSPQQWAQGTLHPHSQRHAVIRTTPPKAPDSTGKLQGPLEWVNAAYGDGKRQR